MISSTSSFADTFHFHSFVERPAIRVNDTHAAGWFSLPEIERFCALDMLRLGSFWSWLVPQSCFILHTNYKQSTPDFSLQKNGTRWIHATYEGLGFSYLPPGAGFQEQRALSVRYKVNDKSTTFPNGSLASRSYPYAPKSERDLTSLRQLQPLQVSFTTHSCNGRSSYGSNREKQALQRLYNFLQGH